MPQLTIRRCCIRLVVVPAALSALFAARAADAPAPSPSFTPNHLFVGVHDNTTNGAAIFEFDEAGALVRRIPVPSPSAIDEAYGVAFGPDGALYCAVYNAGQVVRIDASLRASVFLGTEDGIEAPVGVAFGPGGRVYVGNRFNGGTIVCADSAGRVIDTYAAPAGKYPSFVSIGPEGHVFVSTYSAVGGTIEELDADLRPVRAIGAGLFGTYAGAALFARDGVTYASDYYHAVVRMLGADGDDLGTLPIEGLGVTYGTAIGPDGNLYVADDTRHVVVVANVSTGEVLRTLADPSMCCPSGMAFAPFRFRARIDGTLLRHGGKAVRLVDDAAALSVAPGSGTVMIGLSDLAAAADIPAAFPGVASFVLHGTDAASEDARTRIFQGASVGRDPTADGVGSIELVAKSRRNDAASFAPRTLAGSLHYARAGEVFVATVTASRRIP